MGEWNGNYKSLDEIQNCDTYPTQHNNHLYDYETSLDSLTKFDVHLLGLLSTLDEDIEIIELGCETSCRIYHVLKQHLDFDGASTKLKKYYGIDLPEILKGSVIQKHDNVTLTDDVYQIKEDISIFYCNSSMQYLPEPYEFLKHIFSLSPKYLVFNRTPFTSEEEFLTLPHLYERNWPHRFFGYEKFVSFFKDNGYKLIQKASHDANGIMKGTRDGKPIWNCNQLNLVFTKIRDL